MQTATLLETAIAAGLASGAIYAIMGMSFALMVRAKGVHNFAQGQFAMIGALVGYLLTTVLHYGIWVSIVIALAAGGILGLGVYALVAALRPPIMNALIATFALGLVVQTLVEIWQGDTTFNVGTFPPAPTSMKVGHISVPGQTIWILATCVVVAFATEFAVKRTSFGRRLRAVADDLEVAEAMGISGRSVQIIAFAVSGAMACMAGLVLAPILFMNFQAGQSLTFYAIVASVAGGMNKVAGSLLGGLVLGLSQSFISTFGSPAFSDVVAFTALILVLLYRPQGILRDATEKQS